MPTYHLTYKRQPERKDGKGKIEAKKHYDYISREEKYKNIRNHGEDLRHKSFGNLPPWAKKPGDFWNAADNNGRKNECAYREIEVGLAMELSIDDNIECIEELLKKLGIEKNHMYAYAIHERPARTEKDMVNIHAHIMFNERTIEPERPIDSPELFFKRYSLNKSQEPVGGYKKDPRFENKNFLIDARKIWEQIVNNKLKENGIEETVSCETLEKQKEKLYSMGENQIADTMNRTPAPKMDGLYRNPNLTEEIEKKIRQYEQGILEDKPIENMNMVERSISLYAKDVILRRAARKIQRNRAIQNKKFKKDKTEEEIKNILESPAVVTVRDIQEYLIRRLKQIEKETENNTNEYQEIQKSILKKEWIAPAALQKMTNNQYQKSRKAYIEADKKYKEELAKDKDMLNPAIPNYQEKYNNYLMELRRLETDLKNKKQIYTELKKDCTENRKEELEQTIKQIEKENEDLRNKAKKIYGKNKTLEKENEAIQEILNDFDKADPGTILFSEPIPKQLTRNDRINGTIPLKKLPAGAYKGNIYFIFEGEGEKTKAVRLGDDIEEGKVPVYEIERKLEDGQYKITQIKSTDEKQAIYKEKENSQQLKKYEPKKTPAIQNAIAQQSERTQGALQKTIDTLLDNKAKTIRIRWNEKDEKKKNAMEEAEQKMYEGWHPAFPPRTK